jgi:hypothetical protein
MSKSSSSSITTENSKSPGETSAAPLAKTNSCVAVLWEKRAAVISFDHASLDEVAEADRALVQNVIYAILACKHPDSLCTSWAVTCTPTHYVVSGLLPSGDFDVSLVDMELIQSISPLRISSVSVVCAQEKTRLVIKVLNHLQRVQLTKADVVFTQKRRREWL